jgi:hypothetical protein
MRDSAGFGLPPDSSTVIASCRMETIAQVDPVEQLLREYTNKLRDVIGDVIRTQLAADVTAAVLKAFAVATAPGASTSQPAASTSQPAASTSQPAASTSQPRPALRSPSTRKKLYGDDPDLLKALLKKHSGNVAAVGAELKKARIQINRWLTKHRIDANEFRRGAKATAAAKKSPVGTAGDGEPTNGASSPTSASEPKAAAPRTVRKGKRKGERRSSDIFAQQKFNVLAHLTAHPGQRSGQIAEATGIDGDDLRAVLRKLLGEKKLKNDGVARWTTYTIVK